MENAVKARDCECRGSACDPIFDGGGVLIGHCGRCKTVEEVKVQNLI